MKAHVFSVFVSAILVAGCNYDLRKPESKFAIHQADGNGVYLINMDTGGVDLVSPTGIKKLDRETPLLIAGQYYKTESGKFLKYLGNGTFEASDFAVRKVE